MAPFLLLLILIAPAYAQRELQAKKVPDAPLPWVTTVVSPFAHCAVVNDTAKVLAVSRRWPNPGTPAYSPPANTPSVISIFRLDDAGQVVAGDPVTLEMPKPASLGPRPNFALGLAAHPTLPLLYVWQDVPYETGVDPVADNLAVEFDHFLVYDLEPNPPKLIFATARGENYRCGTNNGGFTLDKPARRLYVPNMQQRDRLKKLSSAIGYLNLNPDGLPDFIDPAVKVEGPAVKPPPPPPLAPPAATASRTARLATWDQAKAAAKPLAMSMHTESTTYTFGGWPCPEGYTPLSDDLVLAAGNSGAAGWVLSDQSGGRFSYFLLQPQIPYRFRLCAHPKFPVAYINHVTYDGRVTLLEHSDGHFTGVPQSVTIEGAVAYSSPMVLEKSNQLVFGANGKICLINLSAEGRFTTTASQMTVNNPTVEAIAWSERFQRLYVPVEKTP